MSKTSPPSLQEEPPPVTRLGFSPVRPFGLLLKRKHKGLWFFGCRLSQLSLQQQQKSDM